MSSILVKMLVNKFFDHLLPALAKVAKRTDNTIDDNLVRLIRQNRDKIIREITR